MLGIIGRGGGANDHAGGVGAIAGNAVRGASIATECSQIGDGEIRLGADTNQTPNQDADRRKANFDWYVHESVIVARFRPTKKGVAGQEEK